MKLVQVKDKVITVPLEKDKAQEHSFHKSLPSKYPSL